MAPVSTYRGPVFSDVRDNKRVMATMSDKSLTVLQQRIYDFIDQEFEMKGEKWNAIDSSACLNERLRFYKCMCSTRLLRLIIAKSHLTHS